MGYMSTYNRWVKEKKLSEADRQELIAIKDNKKEMEERFYKELDFGTAGLRGILGMGTNRMNKYVVERASMGLAAYLRATPNMGIGGVAIAYDSRHMSKEFANVAAEVLSSFGLRVYLYTSLRSVPQLSFTILHLHCDAGIVITASHNPAEYNGFKVYGADGGQITPDMAETITGYINRVSYFIAPHLDLAKGVADGTVCMIGNNLDEAYYTNASYLLFNKKRDYLRGDEIKVVYTPLHGTGGMPMRQLLTRYGFSKFCIVPDQEEPDGDFPTVSAPNPEDPKAFENGIRIANNIEANIVIATDPDADRLGLALRNDKGRFTILTGNQIGCLLIYYILTMRQQEADLPKNGIIVRSIVSTRLADAIADSFDVKTCEVLTGFRYISEIIANTIETREQTFLFGFEESYGFLAGTFTRDKDAISSALLICEAALHYHIEGKTLYDVLLDIYEKYGYFKESVKSYTLKGKDGIGKIKAAMTSLRQTPPSAFGDMSVLSVTDYFTSERLDLADESVSTIDLPTADALMYELSFGGWLCVRPSGTEPKLKLYIGASAKTEAEIDARLKSAMADANALINGLIG